jgi:NADH:ubiquinone oxidoreductase subunit F (NADH-binding)
MSSLSRLVELRGAPHALEEARRRVARDGPLGPGALRRLADDLGVPVAPLRGALSSYADLLSAPAGIRVCRGTSCMLAGADALAASLPDDVSQRPVRCLGYCDRSPAALRRDGRVLLGTPEAGGADGASPPGPAVRSLAGQPIVTRRLGIGAAHLVAARADGAYAALERALGAEPSRVLRAVAQAGVRGRGGAAFPTGTKWALAARAGGDVKYVVANGDEGDPGAFVDRALMEGDPHGILEGMALCAYAVGASEGIVFVRSEYPAALAVMRRAVDEARGAGFLGASVMGGPLAFEVRVVSGHGSYVSGEETALLNAIEGTRSEPRLRPPYPTEAGLWGRPTVVDNVETLVNVPWIVHHGPKAYRRLGTRDSPGTKALCLNAGFARPGIVEVELGTPLRAVLEDAGGGAGGRALAAVLLGGPMGSVLPPEEWDVPLCYAALAKRGLVLGHGGLVAVADDVDFAGLLRHWLEFMAMESCGKCVPCRHGSRRALGLVERGDLAGVRPELDRLLDVMEVGSLCGFGQGIPRPVRRLVEAFGERFAADEGRR